LLKLNLRRKGATSNTRVAAKRRDTAAAAGVQEPVSGSAEDDAADAVAGPELWHWVPQQAVDATVRVIAQAMPTAPMPALLHLLLEINKVGSSLQILVRLAFVTVV
jgi:hypothetical protein